MAWSCGLHGTTGPGSFRRSVKEGGSNGRRGGLAEGWVVAFCGSSATGADEWWVEESGEQGAERALKVAKSGLNVGVEDIFISRCLNKQNKREVARFW
jgi:hypothetical protein